MEKKYIVRLDDQEREELSDYPEKYHAAKVAFSAAFGKGVETGREWGHSTSSVLTGPAGSR